ncbi:preprotein translocase subunit SecA [Caminibacter pacificus]|uniref:Protein translocase subunit SecA n=1 Tax=Caminibacter pacificus TaxID=1424653 RepID=A0AAJ4RDL0_9BACT|nr:preprotein translocase subunit SecA [Caminibacter pacificus]QCI28375.1 preprotein translocase subunit SecA [Caminibacter pacificus]ROR40902.1 protein translocase subunit secA [Caminibacter pacificus]
MVKSVFRKIFGTKNDRELKRYFKRVQEINALEPKYEKLSDEELKNEFNKIKNQVLEEIKNGADEQETLNKYLNDVFAMVREAGKRVLNMRHFDVQLVGGMVLHEGKIAEMKTGEGKTLVATLPVVLNAILGKGVHVVTVNDYLAQRDANEMGKLYDFFGFTTGVVVSGMEDYERKKAYECDVTYGTNSEFGFDYLRDNMAYEWEQKVQRGHYYAIVDEVDSILIDEARTPLIISGPANKRTEDYIRADKVAKQLEKDKHFTIDEKDKVVLLTEEGIKKAEELFGVDNLYTPENAVLAHHLDQALKANYLFKEGRDYIVRKGEVLIVDEFTGRIAEGRRFSEGLHQALEAKEGVEIQEESQTFAETTYQNYFRLYEKLAGMTGTAQTEATEFLEIYGLEVISIPTNKPVARKDLNDLVYKTEEEKFEAVVKKVKELHKKGQPVLIGTTSVQKSEYLSHLLKKEGIPHTVLNAKHHEKEAEIIAQAGRKGAVTVATNMAGRGVDIKIDDEVRELGGLYIIGTERHESRRIDNQLRGRSGRQGDPGVSQFYLSLEDDLLRIFGSDRIKNIMERLGIERGEHIDSKLVSRAIENAQKKVETMHFEARKHILKYDDVANEQRKVIYKFRDQILNPEFNISVKIDEIREEFVDYILSHAEIFEHSLPEEIDIEKLKATLKEYTGIDFNDEELKGKDYSQLREFLIKRLKEEYEKKFEDASPEDKQKIERQVLLQVLDESWRDHLYMMDILKTGIGLRGYNQKDPLVEYKKESFDLFQELIQRIKVESMKVLHNLQIEYQMPEIDPDINEFLKSLEGKDIDEILANIPEIPGEEQFENKDMDEIMKELEAQTNALKAEFEAKQRKKVKRNEPCPCGSGKKYKDCCGKSPKF